MDSRPRQPLAARIADAAAAALRERGHVAAIDVMLGIGWLSPSHVLEWRTRRLPFLERGIQTNSRRIAQALRLLADWAAGQGLASSAADYVARTASREELQFADGGDPSREAAWRTHWVSSELSPAKRARTEAKTQQRPELVVVEPRHDWQCHHCRSTGGLLIMEPEGPACLTCAGLGALELLPAGDALLTRRARAASALSAVVVRWSQTRKRYERTGTLVEPAALATARAGIARSTGA